MQFQQVEYGEPFSIRLKKDQETRLRQLAQKEERALVYFIRQAVDKFLKENQELLNEPA